MSFWLFGAVEPKSGASFVLELPATDGDCLQGLLDRFAADQARRSDEVHVLLLDRSGAHRAKSLDWPERMLPVYLPASCPELNPIERWWQALKDAVSNTLLWCLGAAARLCLDKELQAWQHAPERMASLTGYPHLLHALTLLD